MARGLGPVGLAGDPTGISTNRLPNTSATLPLSQSVRKKTVFKNSSNVHTLYHYSLSFRSDIQQPFSGTRLPAADGVNRRRGKKTIVTGTESEGTR